MIKLEWDSDFWGIEIYNYCIKKDNDVRLPNFQILQSLVDADDIDAIRLLESKNFFFIQNKVNFWKEISCKSDIEIINYRKVSLADLEGKKVEIHNMFVDNCRFKLFNQSKIGEFYYLWLKKSIFGELDHECIGYYEDTKLLGFITYKLEKNEVTIGLVGVFPEYTQMGIGQKLLNYLNNIAVEKKCVQINVSTQGSNYKAINAYIRNGYLINNISSWYYLMNNI